MKNVSIIGGGVMGRGIAFTAVQSGYKVVLQDIDQVSLDKAKMYIKKEAYKAVELGILPAEKKDDCLQMIHYTTSLEEAAEQPDLVIEAVLEDMGFKTEIFKKLDEYCPVNTVLATNTSTMSPTELGAQTARPSKVVAMHFFNPTHKMKLVEIVRGLDTSDETVQIVKNVAGQMKKETVEVNEFPGFVTSRMNCLIGNEAMNMLMEGVASAEDIDKAMKLGLNHPMGPLELADLVGLDTRLRNMEYLHQTLGEKYRPCPLLVKYVKAGRLGKKSGAGFYRYEEGGAKCKTPSLLTR